MVTLAQCLDWASHRSLEVRWFLKSETLIDEMNLSHTQYDLPIVFNDVFVKSSSL